MAWKLEYIPRDFNVRADSLVAVVASILIKETIFLLIYYQSASSIKKNRVSQIDETGSTWMTPILHYPSSGELQNNRTKTHKV